MSSADEPEPIAIPDPDWDLCACGESRGEHDPVTGKCMYCFECGGFEIDEDATILALATMEDQDYP
jgi:hypothetical protein